jgi:hypothetical protein
MLSVLDIFQKYHLLRVFVMESKRQFFLVMHILNLMKVSNNIQQLARKKINI